MTTPEGEMTLPEAEMTAPETLIAPQVKIFPEEPEIMRPKKRNISPSRRWWQWVWNLFKLAYIIGAEQLRTYRFSS